MLRTGVGFLALTMVWVVVAVTVFGDAHTVPTAVIWWTLLIMAMAAAYYILQDRPAARVNSWIRRDLLINWVLFAVLMLAILDGTAGFARLGWSGAGWVAFAAALLHPLVVDRPHLHRHRDDPAGSPVPQYIPPACLVIDWTLAALTLGAVMVV